MLSRNNIKYINSLSQKKYRQQYRQFIAEGDKIIKELLHTDGYTIQWLIATKDWLDKMPEEQLEKPESLIEVKETEMERISQLKTPNQVLAVVNIPRQQEPPDSLQNSLCLAFESIRNPGNLGTIMRIADWFGIPAIYCSGDSADLYNPKVIQATMGSFIRVKPYYTDLQNLISNYKEPSRLYATVLHGSDIYQKKLSNKGIVFFGNESSGLSKELEGMIDNKIAIPSFQRASQGAESLNLSVSAGIICSEFRRQNHYSK